TRPGSRWWPARRKNLPPGSRPRFCRCVSSWSGPASSRSDGAMTVRCPAAIAAIAVAALGVATPTLAQSGYPNRTIRIVAPFPAGAAFVSVARLGADRLEKAWGQPVVVENRGGGGGIVGTNAAAKSPADGYTLLFTSTSPLAAAPALTRSVPYDSVRDFAPIWAINASGLVVVVNPAL